MPAFLSELGVFLRTRKRYWLLPLIVFAVAIAILLFMVSQRSALAPFIYSLEPVVRPVRAVTS
ncbi:MAG: hypothetical protein H0U59_07295 [Gemmatimonadaceae bacterium]|nr:hypothetical protein [Gemmatimonadaceae bacterium]